MNHEGMMIGKKPGSGQDDPSGLLADRLEKRLRKNRLKGVYPTSWFVV